MYGGETDSSSADYVTALDFGGDESDAPGARRLSRRVSRLSRAPPVPALPARFSAAAAPAAAPTPPLSAPRATPTSTTPTRWRAATSACPCSPSARHPPLLTPRRRCCSAPPRKRRRTTTTTTTRRRPRSSASSTPVSSWTSCSRTPATAPRPLRRVCPDGVRRLLRRPFLRLRRLPYDLRSVAIRIVPRAHPCYRRT